LEAPPLLAEDFKSYARPAKTKAGSNELVRLGRGDLATALWMGIVTVAASFVIVFHAAPPPVQDQHDP